MPENAGIRTRRPAPIAGDPLQHGQEAGALGHRIGPAHCRIVEFGLDHINWVPITPPAASKRGKYRYLDGPWPFGPRTGSFGGSFVSRLNRISWLIVTRRCSDVPKICYFEALGPLQGFDLRPG